GSKSTFLTTGQITPEEFVQAGDYLAHMFPTWKWNEESSDISYRDFLPKNKQFLIIRKVPADKRAEQAVEAKDMAQERYYDLYIAYSTSYRVPKMYIVGFNSNGSPLSPEQMFEDISADYRTKTATIEKLPFYKNSVLSVSIHPCKHANVMKILLDKVRVVRQRRRKELQEEQELDGVGDWEDLQDDIDDSLRVDQYLIVFLKFITSVTPSIQHDYTMEGW
uniref:Autophagy-related protein 3,Autophagy-related protein 3 n=1 Tax=Saccharomyces cerevisiae (strain ATCC 204508 / S288c) TaxID=559292 RepID=UPI0011C34277|nr:Chain A, Autophagy-related protein 3,Autophagy-related protein 3 [Saccharomyces cerevisiae S288C]